MQWNIPRTVFTGTREEADGLRAQFEAMFLPGGMMLSQVTALTGLEAYTVQNWVKRGFLPPPRDKRYSLRQLCRIMLIQMLKSSLTMEQICGLLSYVNGRLDDEGDDLIDDTVLYFTFVRLAARAQRLDDPEERRAAMEATLADYAEPIPGAKKRVEDVLTVMLAAWAAGQLRHQAEVLLLNLQ